MFKRLCSAPIVIFLVYVVSTGASALGDTEIALNVHAGSPFDFKDDQAVWIHSDRQTIYGAYVTVSGDKLLVSDFDTHVTDTDYVKFGAGISGDRVAWMDGRAPGDPAFKERPFDTNDDIIVSRPEAQWHPSIYGDYMVWWDQRSGDWQTQVYHIPTGYEYTIPEPPDAGVNIHPHSEIWENTVAWKTDWDQIGLHDIATNDTYTIDVDPATYLPNDNFGLYESTLVWYAASTGPDEGNGIYAYDLLTGEQQKIIWRNSGIVRDPQVYENWLVWSEKKDGDAYYNIYAYDLASQREYQITNDKCNQWEPQIWGDAVLWYDNRDGGDTWHIYGTVIPEPSAMILLTVGAFGVTRRRK